MNKIYTFGCSFTNYCWDTWATLLLSSIEGENWALPGGGNKFIYESLVECNVTNRIDSSDTVIIMWSSWSREDRYLHDGWSLFGNVYNAKPMYDKHFLEKYWCDRGAVLHNFNFICGAIELLKATKCKWHFCSAYPFYQFKEFHNTVITDIPNHTVFQKYIDYINEHKEHFVDTTLLSYPFDQVLWKETPWGKNQVDNHPDPEIHYTWTKDNLFPRLELTDQIIKNIEMYAEASNNKYKEMVDLGVHPTLQNQSLSLPGNRV